MNMKEVYDQFQGNYEDVMRRLKKEDRIQKYLLKFVENGADHLIRNALQEEDYEMAFREAHNLKGICANLSMDTLAKSTSELTESLRGGKPQADVTPLLDAMQKDYDMTVEAIANLTEVQ